MSVRNRRGKVCSRILHKCVRRKIITKFSLLISDFLPYIFYILYVCIIKVIKVAVDPVWHLPRLAEAVGVGETLLRERLAQWTQNNTVLDPDNKVFLPSIGGTTLYLFGDPSAITDPDREVACRPHDECNGSDVFGTDICTCRPYLVYVSLSVTVSKPSAEAASP